MEPIHMIYAFVSICLAFVVKGLAGFGDPLVSTPLLSMVFPTSIITPGITLVSPLLNAGVVWKNRAHFSASIVLPISICNMLGAIPGTMLLKYGSPKGMKLFLGLLIIGLGVEMLTRKPSANAAPNAVVRSLVSFASGFTGGLFGINLLFVAYMERVAPSREEFRANTCFVFFLENIFRAFLYLVQGLYSRESLLLTLAALPAALLGMKIGAVIDKRVSDRLSRRLMIYVFIGGGISAAINALLQYL